MNERTWRQLYHWLSDEAVDMDYEAGTHDGNPHEEAEYAARAQTFREVRAQMRRLDPTLRRSRDDQASVL